jgi:hypothetical protein
MSMRSETLSLEITGDGKGLNVALEGASSRLGRFMAKAGSMMSGLRKGFGAAVGKFANPLALIGGPAGVVMAARDIAEYQDKISTMGIKAGLSAAKMMEFEKSITSASYTTGQGRDALAGAASALLDIADADFAAEALSLVGKAATATSTDAATAATAFAVFRRDMGATAEQAAEMFNTMAALDNVRGMDGFAKSAQVLGLSMDNFAGYNAMIKTLAPSFGNSGEAAAAAIDQIGVALKTNKSGELAFRFRGAVDKDGAIKDYGKLMEIIAGMNDSTRKKVFARAGASMTGFDVGKATADFDAYMKKAGDAGFVTSAFARKQGEAKFQMNTLASAAKDFAGSALGPALADITAHLSALTGDPAALEEFRGKLSGVAEAIGHIGKGAALVGKALGAWGDYWGRLGAGDPHGMKKKASDKVDRMDPQLRGALQYKYGYDDMYIEGKSRQYLNKDGTVKTDRLAALTAENRERHASKQAKAAAPEVKNAIQINMQVAPDGRVVTEIDGKNTSAAVNVNRGRF